jgi:hypothetical protein
VVAEVRAENQAIACVEALKRSAFAQGYGGQVKR